MFAAVTRNAAPALRSMRMQRLGSTAGSLTQDGIQFKGKMFPFRWLKDSCQCPQCIHPSTQQKLHRTSDIAPNVRPESDAIRVAEDGIHVSWGPNHKAFYSSEFLDRYSSPSKLHEFHRDAEVVTWDKHRVEASPHLFVSYDSLKDGSKLLPAMTQLIQYGLLFVTGVPNGETSNDTCEARHLAELFGELRETFYGRLWDVINLQNSTNIAYTNLDLGLHMDLL